MELNERIKELRLGRNLSVYRLSHLSDVSQNYIRTIEKGKSQPSVQIIEKLLKPLGITLCEFFRNDENILYPSSYEQKLIQAARKLNAEELDILLSLAEILGNNRS